MDLSRIEAWTRDMLEREARRRGIRNCEFRSRGELVRLILRHQYGDRVATSRERIAKGVQTVRQARELLGAAVSAGLASLPEPLETLLRLRGQASLPPREPAAPQHATRETRQEWGQEWDQAWDQASHAPAEATSSHALEEPTEASITGAEEPAVGTSTPVETGAVPAGQPTLAAETALRQEAAAAVPPPPDAARAAASPATGATTRTFSEEPIRTRSMARLLASQGHTQRALLIYEELLARNSGDPELAREAAALRNGEALDAEVGMPAPDAQLPQHPRDGADHIDCRGEGGAGLRVRWNVTPEGMARARAVLGQPGELAIRVVTIAKDPERVVRTDITEHGPVLENGEWTSPPVEADGRCFAAVGLRANDRFVSITHVQT